MNSSIDWKNLARNAARQIFIIFCLTAIFVLGCRVSAGQSISSQLDKVFNFDDGTTFAADFPGGRLNDCKRVGVDEFVLSIEPECVPINDSPWYAFSVTTDSARDVLVHLKYKAGGHRYQPQLRRPGESWQALSAKRLTAHPRSRCASLLLPTNSQPTTVAAHELLTVNEVDAWTQQVAGHPSASREVIGRSRESRSIEKIDIGNPRADKCVVIIGRQHPPEVTGHIGLMAFTETLLEDTGVAADFRRDFHTVVVPMVNPDGVQNGQWRTNSAAIDLNRDWGRFTQPETCCVRDEIQRLTADGRAQLYLFIDFHSTYQDVFYTQSDDAVTFPPQFTRAWLTSIDRRTPRYRVLREANHGSAFTSKAWIHRTFGAPAITYEFGDDTEREEIDRIATIAAQEMMRLLSQAARQQLAAR